MENEDVVKEDLTNPTPTEGEIKQEAPVEAGGQPAPGSKTPSELLLQSLHEEREKRRIAEEANRILEEKLNTSTQNEDDEVISDEAKILKKEISSLNDKIVSIEEEKEFEKLFAQYPILKEKIEELKEYRTSLYPGGKIESVAKLYLAENGFFEKPRAGLEKPTGGDKTVTKSGYTAEEVAEIRKNDSRKYEKLIREGKLVIRS